MHLTNTIRNQIRLAFTYHNPDNLHHNLHLAEIHYEKDQNAHKHLNRHRRNPAQAKDQERSRRNVQDPASRLLQAISVIATNE